MNEINFHGAISQQNNSVTLITELIRECYLKSGVTIKDEREEVYSVSVKSLLIDFFGAFKDLSVQDVQLAFDRGLNGEYGDFMGINYSTLRKFLNEYAKTKRKADAQNPQKENLLPEHDISPQEFLNEMWREFEKGNDLIWAIGDKIFDKCVETGRFTHWNELRDKYMEMARDALTYEKRREAEKSNNYERSAIMAMIEALADGDASMEEMMEKRAKTIYTRDYFIYLQEREKGKQK